MHGRTIPAMALVSACVVSAFILLVARAFVLLVERALRSSGADARTAREWSCWTITSALWLAAGAPLWLGPVADLGARSHADVPSAIVACSPLVHLAVASGYDLLRSQWFYGHTSLGALQVDYPRLTTLLLVYAGASVLLTLVSIPFGRRPNDTSPIQPRMVQGERQA
jgi:hypothetical protein